jgi:hypothetical protein
MAADGMAVQGGGAAAAGLVLSTTSDTAHLYGLNAEPQPLAAPKLTGAASKVILEIDPMASRAKRCRKSILTGARLHVEETQSAGVRGRWAMVTCTYRPGSDASPRDISGLLKCIRSYLGRLGCAGGRAHFRYLWCLELTKARVPHYHVLVRLPRGVTLPKPDKRGWWPHGSTRIEWARKAVGYLAKYASKFTRDVCDAIPKGFRTHAVGGLNAESKRQLRWWKSPLDAREALGLMADIRKSLGGYLDRVTGAFWPSPWRVFLTPDGRVFAWKSIEL